MGSEVITRLLLEPNYCGPFVSAPEYLVPLEQYTPLYSGLCSFSSPNIVPCPFGIYVRLPASGYLWVSPKSAGEECE